MNALEKSVNRWQKEVNVLLSKQCFGTAFIISFKVNGGVARGGGEGCSPLIKVSRKKVIYDARVEDI